MFAVSPVLKSATGVKKESARRTFGNVTTVMPVPALSVYLRKRKDGHTRNAVGTLHCVHHAQQNTCLYTVPVVEGLCVIVRQLYANLINLFVPVVPTCTVE